MASTPSLGAKAKIFTLPPEVIEEILIFSALYGFPSVVARLSRTCRSFHQLVYRSTDNHLWREVFLTTFDDPRPVLGRIKGATTFSAGNATREDYTSHSEAREVEFDWKREFIRRIDGVRVMRWCPDLEGLDIIETPSHAEDCSLLYGALRSLLSVLETAHPFPAQSRHDTADLSHAFPPILSVHALSSLPDECISSNALWVHRVAHLQCSRVLVKRFLANQPQRQNRRQEVETVELTSEVPEEGQLFHKLVFLSGLGPFFSPVTPANHSTLSAELNGAREFARSRVYNLRYLNPDRCWGPFLPASGNAKLKSTMADSASFPGFQEALARNIMGLGDVLGSTGQLIPIVTSDEEVEVQVTQFTTSSEGVGEDDDYVPNGDEDNDSDDEEYDADDIQLILTNGQLPDPTFIPPKPHQVVPDYTYLSAARVLVEMNLREVLNHDNSVAGDTVEWQDMNRMVDAFGCLQFVRMGGAPGFWENWVVKKDGEGAVSSIEEGVHDTSLTADPIGVTIDMGKQRGKAKHTGRGVGKSRSTDEYEGWDWAGAAGEWKRAVCWLDYRDLLLHNLNAFPRESLEETVRVFPMTLRVSGYSPPPDPDVEPKSTLNMTSTTFPSRSALESLVYTLPVIHLEGESRGSDIDATVLRHVKGTVRVISDGAVRWTLTSSFPDENTPEWVTESIQVGAIGSVVGIIGMWTGAEHAPTDPLGPTWAWKVG